MRGVSRKGDLAGRRSEKTRRSCQDSVPSRSNRMDVSRGPVPWALLLVLAGLVASPGVSAQGLDQSDASVPIAITGSIHLGQVYPSGLLYLDFAGRPLIDMDPDDWPEVVHFVPLDEGAQTAMPRAGKPATARFVGIERNVNPPEIEGMLSSDSPCVFEGYRQRENSAYVGGDGRFKGWEPAEYFATSEWFGCEREFAVAQYLMDEGIDASFRIVAFPPELSLIGFDWSVAGLPRPLSYTEEEQVANRRLRNPECTLQPLDRDDAEQLLRFDINETPYSVRLSSHLLACTSLGEVFIVDALEGDTLLDSRTIGRWRGNY